MQKKYNKTEAVAASVEFLKELAVLQDKHGVSINSDEGDIYLTYKREPTSEDFHIWGTIDIGWEGDGTGLKVTEVIKDEAYRKKQALAKLSPEDRKTLGL
jgi:hypothetical protein